MEPYFVSLFSNFAIKGLGSLCVLILWGVYVFWWHSNFNVYCRIKVKLYVAERYIIDRFQVIIAVVMKFQVFWDAMIKLAMKHIS